MQPSSVEDDSVLEEEAYVPRIHVEQTWRKPFTERTAKAARSDRVTVARWTLPDGSMVDTGATSVQDRYVVGVSLRSTRLIFQQEGEPIFEGHVLPGMFQVTCPGVPARATFRAGCDILHLLLPVPLLDSVSSEAYDGLDVAALLLQRPGIIHDPCIERLANALMLADGSFRAYGQLYMDSVSIALMSRLLELCVRPRSDVPRTRHAGLPKWRLQRVVDFIEAHLSEPIGLENLAGAAGLTRMHFARQFRLATGFRPHEYVLRRRIEYAQSLLASERSSLLDVAQRSGFQTQAHFTTVFRKVVGTTPKCWRNAILVRGE
jgi:AraC family transcriptional regulator